MRLLIVTNKQHSKIDVASILKKKYYFQGFNGTPGLLTFGAPSSCKYMYEYLGYGYSVLVDFYENDKAYYGYAWDDLHNINDHLMQNLKKNKDYLKVIWQKHTSINKEHFNVLKKLDKLEHQVAIFLEKAGVDLSKKGTKKSSLQIAPVEENLFD